MLQKITPDEVARAWGYPDFATMAPDLADSFLDECERHTILIKTNPHTGLRYEVGEFEDMELTYCIELPDHSAVVLDNVMDPRSHVTPKDVLPSWDAAEAKWLRLANHER